jgi:hypothetical protein
MMPTHHNTFEERIRNLEQRITRLEEQTRELPDVAKRVETIDREIFAAKATAAFTRWLTVLLAGVAGYFADRIWKRVP